MPDCNLCFDEITDDNSCEIVCNIDNECVIKPSKTCLECMYELKKNIIPCLLKSIANEICEASIKRIMKADLPTHLSVDCTGRGQIISKIIKNKKVISSELESNLSSDEINELNGRIRHIRELIQNDDDLFLYEKKIAFEKFA